MMKVNFAGLSPGCKLVSLDAGVVQAEVCQEVLSRTSIPFESFYSPLSLELLSLF